MLMSPSWLILSLIIIFTTLAIVHSNQDKIATSSPFSFYSTLEGDDVWFDTTTDDEIQEHWSPSSDFHVTRRLNALATYSYTVCLLYPFFLS